MKKYINGKYLDLTEEEVNLLDKNLPIQPLTIEERLCEVEKINQTQDELINISLMATDEMYIMIEPLLEVAQINEGVKSKMVDMYVAMVMRGLKDINEVPLRYREEVKKMLEALE